MTLFSEKKFVIFDYSGTLSLEAPRFGRHANLMRALVESGLFSLGVTTPELFWEEIVGPTWTVGSTTAIGYKRVMVERIGALGLVPSAAVAEIAKAASRFVDLYLAHSPIDPLWRPILENLAGLPGTAVVIATDHYAEATETIIRYLRSWNIPAQKAGEGADPLFLYFVANSADIGSWKADRCFWKTLKLQIALKTVRSILIIDDFGFNEELGDIYSERAKVDARQKKTQAVLHEVFQTEVEVIPFFLGAEERDREEARTGLIAETARRIDLFLNSGYGARNSS